MSSNPQIHVTVAAIIESGGRFLLVEEQVDGRVVLNQPAGHLDPGESLPAAAARETFEETGYTFVPSHLVGIYHWQNETDMTFVRFAFCGKHTAPTGPVHLVRRHRWRALAHAPSRCSRASANCGARWCIRGVDDYLAGARYSLDLVPYLSWERLERRATDVGFARRIRAGHGLCACPPARLSPGW